jgi:prokaryotic ubiquitin-like protein Pup
MARFIERFDRSSQSETDVVIPLCMAAGEQKQRSKGGGEGDESASGEAGSKKLAKKGEELKEEMDALVDEIDAVLEENAEEFVKNYVQRGGQ